jgi:hypothetical protein
MPLGTLERVYSSLRSFLLIVQAYSFALETVASTTSFTDYDALRM